MMLDAKEYIYSIYNCRENNKESLDAHHSYFYILAWVTQIF